MEKPYFALVVSDIHLKDQHDPNVRPLLNLLETFGPKVQNLVLLGDIFDFCFGRPKYFKQKFSFFESALLCMDHSTQIFFVEGNHEFHVGELGWNIHFVKGDELILGDIKFCHGDHFAPEWSYQLFKRTIKSKAFYNLSYLIPPMALDAYATTHAKVSRSMEQDFNHSKILEAAFGWLKDYRLGVFGHYHVPYYVEKKGLRVAALDCWENPNCLVIDPQKKVLRGSFHESKGWLLEEAKYFQGPSD